MNYPNRYMSPSDHWLEQRKQAHERNILEISQKVASFFWDDAPNKFGFESREGQIDMAFEIVDAMKKQKHIVVEAGVGIGKSFAYLVPLLYYHEVTGKPVVIATSTIALQEQLIGDAERLKKLLDIDVPVMLCKGQTHYICYNKAKELFKKTTDPFEVKLMRDIILGTCDRRDFDYQIPSELWDRICVKNYSKRTCEKCQNNCKCKYYQMRADMYEGDCVIICNQDLLTAHLKKRSYGMKGMLPDDIGLIVVDEAHNLESKVRSSTTVSLSRKSIMNAVNTAWKSLPKEQQGMAVKRYAKVTSAVNAIFSDLSQQVNAQIKRDRNMDQNADRFFFKTSGKSMRCLENALDALRDLDVTVDIYASMDRRKRNQASATDELEDIIHSMEELLEAPDDHLIWIERLGRRMCLVFCPKDTSSIIRELYFEGRHKTILTSATLTNQSSGTNEEQYQYFIDNTNFPVDEGVVADSKPSPFPYNEHAMIYYCDDLPHPTKEHDKFMDQAVEKLAELLKISNGKAMVLFTAKSDLEEVYRRLVAMKPPYKVLKQTKGASQDSVIQEFKENTNSVLLGTGAFWEGISIEGESLSHLIIFRLPFPLPDPIIDYKSTIAENALMEVLVPEMVIKLKQGIGRLIRNFSDKGLVSIIDSRLRDENPTPYHDIAWESLPIKNRTASLDEARQFYEQLNIGK